MNKNSPPSQLTNSHFKKASECADAQLLNKLLSDENMFISESDAMMQPLKFTSYCAYDTHTWIRNSKLSFFWWKLSISTLYEKN